MCEASARPTLREMCSPVFQDVAAEQDCDEGHGKEHHRAQTDGSIIEKRIKISGSTNTDFDGLELQRVLLVPTCVLYDNARGWPVNADFPFSKGGREGGRKRGRGRNGEQARERGSD